MRKREKYVLALAFVFILVGASLYGLFKRPPRLGLDLVGGIHVILTAVSKPGAPVTSATMNQAQFIIENRVNALGVVEPQIERQGRENILIQLPGVKDPQEALEIIGKTALLEFAAVEKNYEGVPTKELNKLIKRGTKVLGETLLTGEVIKDARIGQDELAKSAVDITFKPDGAKRFDEIAKKFFGRQLAIVLDGEIISAPTIQATEFKGKAQITGDFTSEEAQNLVLVLKTGALPVELKISEHRTVGPTLGHDSLIAGLEAGLVGLGLVALFMLIYYRLFGFLSWISLAVFASLLCGLLVVVGVTLTLPGIAGIILMVGIAADSSIIIFERIKEEAQTGKTLRVAMETGFSHGFKTFLDADLVSFITALILFYFGVGPVKGFALTLMLGIICDIFTSFLFTRSVLGLLAQTKLSQKPNFLGIKVKEVV